MSARCLRLGPLGVRRLGAAFRKSGSAAKLQSISRPCIFAAGSRICRYSTVTPDCALGSYVVVADPDLRNRPPLSSHTDQRRGGKEGERRGGGWGKAAGAD